MPNEEERYIQLPRCTDDVDSSDDKYHVTPKRIPPVAEDFSPLVFGNLPKHTPKKHTQKKSSSARRILRFGNPSDEAQVDVNVQRVFANDNLPVNTVLTATPPQSPKMCMTSKKSLRV